MNKGIRRSFQLAMEVPIQVRLRGQGAASRGRGGILSGEKWAQERLPGAGAMEIFGQVRISGIGAASRGHGGTWSGEDKMAMSGLQNSQMIKGD